MHDETIDPTPYTEDLAYRALDNMGEFYPGLTQAQAEHVITEALFLASTDLRNGRAVDLDYIGQLQLCPIWGDDGDTAPSWRPGANLITAS